MAIKIGSDEAPEGSGILMRVLKDAGMKVQRRLNCVPSLSKTTATDKMSLWCATGTTILIIRSAASSSFKNKKEQPSHLIQKAHKKTSVKKTKK
ncbi:hypothetical protein E2C01_066648 [Portunus trituberculatus]|uniref:Uncharacterized protein n=1 Tax=Portunus trituberculatus TaxID=210409 RepID=A0A5B7HRJ0_PORTR|nr:hypothetical protein [Portunus trituberculatus]